MTATRTTKQTAKGTDLVQRAAIYTGARVQLAHLLPLLVDALRIVLGLRPVRVQVENSLVAMRLAANIGKLLHARHYWHVFR